MNAVKPIKSIDDLVMAGLVAPADRIALEAVAARYAIALTPVMTGLIDRADPDDPIARQFVPDAAELTVALEERADPIGDQAHSPVEGIVHRYPDRVLLKAVHVCPVYCRFCFRREMVGPQGLGTLDAVAMQAAFDYIKGHGEIWEVILTGGDPLVLSPRRLRDIMEALAEFAHVKIVRFHTRVPVVEPERIDAALIAALKASGKTVYVALHANHVRELTAEARAACARLVDAGIAMVSQSVLLKGVNDDPDVLAELMKAFVEIRVKPYYLHHPDLAPGTGHFRLTIEEGQRIVAALHGRISGLCQPTYILDIPGGHGKAVVSGSTVRARGEGCYSVSDYRGNEHSYPPVD
ncbi:lysine-2,3-aminomutase-like protein [Rhizobium hidalgonense]|uniref:Lysine 2,3-aminomutase n=1 Tax=Rhizobium hidalgonense TaxID=1538159 RepID=A0A2A6KIN0_9HYPH|nr:lysine-2,3-aminomutase-like protein [Rhizobium hidalgonense]EJC76241.1 lysine-2,3-aminomutase-related protein [Rhizobium leguminosarum bv. trifolii WSM2012]MDR9773763.1 lysine-2,3-aminomutase-like protein [Rhizobium hidalgonense]MDR9806707.1 lysine-2,3-aminomutase-like protein [Rhizobium hidalgonense]MDR9810911.1 lysine-2,3-aminomutase-like protein [Rhizobium hidalgonense]MDR9819859.1 lysine-2,3-aminomutase-like protein [Rhizobium hidalgonense]